MTSKVTYRQQYTRCGKERCRKCKEGPGHGPYWYAFYSENGRTISKYIGIHAPAGLKASTQLPTDQPEQPASSVPDIPMTSSTTPEQSAAGRAAMAAPLSVPGHSSRDEAAQDQPLLRIYVLGHFRIELRNGNEWVTVTNRTWQRRRARALLGCLLSNSNRRLGREQAMEALWPDLDIDIASNRLNGAVHEVRQVLEPGLSRPAASRLLRLERDMLTLADASLIWVDAEAFEKLLNKIHALTDPAQIEQAIDEALSLYSGDYLLEELYSEWAAPRREALRRSWMGLLLKLAELRASRGALTSAIEPLDRLLASDPTHETAVRRLMELLTQLDRRGEAFHVYQRLVETLNRDYESDPLPETTALYRALRQGTYQIPQPAVRAAPATTTPPSTSTLSPSEERQPGQTALQITDFPRPVFQLVRHNQSKLVGRDEEFAAMQQFLRAIMEETQAHKSRRKIAHMLLLLGEPGIGKTRLAEELSYEADQDGWSVVWAHGYEQEGSIPYRPWAEIFRSLLKDIPTSLLIQRLEAREQASPAYEASPAGYINASAQARLARVGTLVPELSVPGYPPSPVARDALSLTPEQERLHLWEAATAILSILSQSAPLLLVLDDLHWTDDSSLALLAYVVRHMQHEHIAIVATCRDAETSPGSNLSTLIYDLKRERAVLTLPVRPLTETSISSLLSHLPDHIVQGIQRQAGGNPFFAEELARVSEASQEGQPLTTTTTPESIMAVLDRRLNKLSSACQSLLARAAVLGGSFALSQLTILAGEQGANDESIYDLLEEALRAGLLTEEGTGSNITYHFWHPLIVNHLYERQSAARRAQLHRKAASALIQLYQGHEEEVAATITHHLIRGGGDTAQIGHFAELAGARAYALYAYTEVETNYRLAVDALTGGKPDQQIKAPLHVADMLERIAECNMIHGNFEEGRKLYERVLELRSLHCARLGSGISKEEAQRQALIWREIGRALVENGNIEESTRCYEIGQQVMIDAGVSSGAAWACLLFSHGNNNWRLGNNALARQQGLQALAMLEGVMQAQARQAVSNTGDELPTRTSLAMIGSPFELGRCHDLLGIIAATLGQFSESLEHLHQAIAIFEQHDLVNELTLDYGNLAAVHATKAEYEKASALFQRALQMAQRDSNLPMMAWVYGNLGETAARRGYLAEAEEQMRQSLALAEQINDPEQASWTQSVLATILCDRGDMPAALSHIRRALKMGRAIKSVLCMGMALIALGDWRIARAVQVSPIHFIISPIQSALRDSASAAWLHRAALALKRALALEGLNAEAATECRLTLASALYFLGEIETAKEEALQSLRAAEQHELLRVAARSQRLLGRILAAEGLYREADDYSEAALRMFTQHEMRLEYARTLHGYGVILLQRSPPGSEAYQRGLSYLHDARDLFIECGAAIDLQWVERMLSDPAYDKAGV